MTKRKIQAGFGVVEIVCGLVVIALIGLVGWYVWNNNATHLPNSQKSAAAQTTVSTPVDKYQGWKAYCDDLRKACFKYPNDWTIDSGAEGATFENQSKTVVVDYNNNDTRDGATVPYYVAGIEGLTINNTSLNVLGGFVVVPNNVRAEYKIVDAAFATGLTVGQQGAVANTARFTNKDGTHSHLEAYPTNTDGYDSNKAKIWFTSSDAQTAKRIIESFYFK